MLASHHLIWWCIWCDISSCLYHVVLMGGLKMQNHVQFCTKKPRIFWWNQGDVCVTYSVFRAVSEMFGSSIWYIHVFPLFLYVFRFFLILRIMMNHVSTVSHRAGWCWFSWSPSLPCSAAGQGAGERKNHKPGAVQWELWLERIECKGHLKILYMYD